MIRPAVDGFRRCVLRCSASALCALAAACAPEAPAVAPSPAATATVRLVDSIPWADEMGEGVLRRVEVHAGSRVDTIPGLLTAEMPLVIGDTSIMGFVYKHDAIAAGFRYDPRTRVLTRTPMPGDVTPARSAPGFSPDGAHIGYLAYTDTKGWAIVRTWPAGERVLRSDVVEVPATDAPGGNLVRWVSPDTVEFFMETGHSTDNAWYHVRMALNPARIISADTLYTSPF